MCVCGAHSALLPLKGPPTYEKKTPLFQGFIAKQGRQCTYLHRVELYTHQVRFVLLHHAASASSDKTTTATVRRRRRRFCRHRRRRRRDFFELLSESVTCQKKIAFKGVFPSARGDRRIHRCVTGAKIN